jgi:hypothetical protein
MTMNMVRLSGKNAMSITDRERALPIVPFMPCGPGTQDLTGQLFIGCILLFGKIIPCNCQFNENFDVF